MKIEGELGGRLDVKKFDLSRLTISEKCPKCKEICYHDTLYPLSYPTINGVNEISFECEECGHEFDKKIKLIIKVEPM